MWERPISTQQAGFVIVTQSRKDLPDAVGGVTWFTPDEASTSCFTPLYCANRRLARPYVKGDYKKFSWDSAWWVTNLVSNLAYDRWSRVIPDVQKAQAEQEAALLKMQPVIEETAAKLAATRPGPDERVPDQLFGLDRRGRLPPLAGAGRVDPDQARRRLREGPQGHAQGARLLGGMAPARSSSRGPTSSSFRRTRTRRDRSLNLAI